MHPSYLLNKTHQAIKIRCMQVTKQFIKQNSPSDQNTVHASYLLNKIQKAIKIPSDTPSNQNTVHAS